MIYLIDPSQDSIITNLETSMHQWRKIICQMLW